MDTRISLTSLPTTPKVAINGEVFHAVLSPKEVLVCAFSQKKGCGGVVGIDVGSAVAAAQAIIPLVSGLVAHGADAKDLVFKLAGPHGALRLVRQFLFDRQLHFAADFETTARTEIYFYSSTGRLRAGVLDGSESGAKKKVLIVDDSATMRRILRHTFSEHPGLQVVGEAELPSKVEQMIADLHPDILTLDIHMPEMDGITLLKRIMKKSPLPVVMVSSVSYAEGVEVLKALELGAIDYIEKPKHEAFDELGPSIAQKVFDSAKAKVRPSPGKETAKRAPAHVSQWADIPIVICASTGGTEAIKEILLRFPKDVPPILIAQHIPGTYSRAFAERLNEACAFPVREAVNGCAIEHGTALIAPGGQQMAIRRGSKGYALEIGKGIYASCFEPSADLLFETAAECFGKKAIGIILTGMGSDGAHGLLKMRQAGAHTIAQDEATSVVFGMPRVAIELGAAEVVSPIESIADHIRHWLEPAAMKKAA